MNYTLIVTGYFELDSNCDGISGGCCIFELDSNCLFDTSQHLCFAHLNSWVVLGLVSYGSSSFVFKVSFWFRLIFYLTGFIFIFQKFMSFETMTCYTCWSVLKVDLVCCLYIFEEGIISKQICDLGNWRKGILAHATCVVVMEWCMFVVYQWNEMMSHLNTVALTRVSCSWYEMNMNGHIWMIYLVLWPSRDLSELYDSPFA